MSDIKVEIGQYREVNKGVLKAYFSFIIQSTGQKILDCRYFVSGDQRWFNFPAKEVKYTDGRKNDYIPIISYSNKTYLEALKLAVLTALKDAKPKESYGKTNDQQTQPKENTLQDNTPFVWE